MRKNLRTAAIVAGASAGLVLVPAGIAYASGFGGGPQGNGDRTANCTYDRQQDRQQLRDGTGPRHDDRSATAGNAYRSGPADGTGPYAARPLDGTGSQWGQNG